MDETYLELPLFDFADRLEREARQPSAATIARRAKPSWRPYTAVARRQCDPCVGGAMAAEKRGETPPIPRHARHVRTIAATGEETAMCETHALAAKAADGITEPRTPAGRRKR